MTIKNPLYPLQVIAKDINIDKQSANKQSELSITMDEVESVLAYLCRTSDKLNQKFIKSLIKAKKLYQSNRDLSTDEEATFWIDYHQLANSIKPATIESINQTNPSLLWKINNPKITKKVKWIPIYYGFGIFSMIVVTFALQSYYQFGVDVLQKTQQLFTERNKINTERNKLNADRIKVEMELKRTEQLNQPDKKEKKDNNQKQTDSGKNSETKELTELDIQYEKLDHEFDANRIMLYSWISIWSMSQNEQKMKIKFSIYDDYLYNFKLKKAKSVLEDLEYKLKNTNKDEKDKLKKDISEAREELHKIEKARQLARSRNLFFSAQLSTVYALNLLESFALPLLFGCLGACTLVLRSIHTSFQNATFTLRKCSNYKLRIMLGMVTGVSSGMFFGNSQAMPEGEFSHMLIAFLVGYNVEILFGLMDNLAQRFAINSKTINEDARKPK